MIENLKYIITSNERGVKDLRIVLYLLISGVLGYGLSLIADNEVLALIFAPAINFTLYRIAENIKKDQ